LDPEFDEVKDIIFVEEGGIARQAIVLGFDSIVGARFLAEETVHENSIYSLSFSSERDGLNQSGWLVTLTLKCSFQPHSSP